MKANESSSTHFSEGIKRLFSSLLVGSLFLFLSSAHLAGQCSITLTSVEGSDNQTVCINTAIISIVYSTVEATGADFTGLPSGVTGNWSDNNVTITGTPTVSGNFNFTVTATGVTCENTTASGVITVNELLPVSVSITADDNPVCEGTTVNFTATPVNGGTVPSYQWYVDATSVGTGGDTYSYIPDNGDVVTCVLTSDLTCVSNNPATSNAIEMTVNEILPVGVSIAALPAGPVCAETSVTFTATPVNGGITPVYQWYLNGEVVGSDQPSYTSSTLGDGDDIYCILTSSEICASGNPATSNTVTMEVNLNLPVSVSIAALPAGPVCAETSVTFTATPVNGGITPVYQWYLNGAIVGDNQPSYTSSTLSDGDDIYCILTSSEICASGNPATSNTVTMEVNLNLPVSVSIAALPAGPVCSGTSVTFTATPVNGGTTPTYQWYVDATAVGTGGTTYSYTPGNGDVVSCVLTSSETCASGSPAASNDLTMEVNANLPVSVSISALPAGPVCSGTSVTFTATPVNGGTTPTYQWYVDATPVGTGGTTYTYIPDNGDVVTCVLTSDLTCVSNNPETSNAIEMTVNSLPIPLITGPATICAGTAGNVYSTESGMSNYIWSVSAGGTLTAGQGTNTITVEWNTAGPQTVSVIYTNTNNCTASAPTVYDVVVYSLPEIPTASVDCSLGFGNAIITVTSPVGEGLEYRLDAGEYQTTLSFAGVANGSHTITVRNSSGCATIGSSFNVDCGCVNGPTLILSSTSGSTCGLAPKTISGNSFGGSATSVAISENGAGTVSPATEGTSPFAFTYTPAAGDIGNTVTINVTTDNPLGAPCAEATATYILTVNALPEPSITGTTSVCSGTAGNVYSTEAGMNNYTWSVSAGGIITAGGEITDNSVTVTWNTAGLQTLSVNYANANNCTATEGTIYNVTVNPQPSSITGTTHVSEGLTTTLVSTPSGGTWSSSIPAVATINSSTGLVSGVSQGNTVITYSPASGCSVSTVFSVLPAGWQVNPMEFTYNSLVTAEVFVEGTVAESGFLAAFVGNECRGIGESDYNSQYDNHIFELICYSDTATGDVMVFRYFNPAENVEYNMDRSVNFDSEIDVGSASAPFIMNIGTAYSLSLPIGWNWFSVNSTLDNMSLQFILSSVNTKGDYIKSQTETASYYEGFGWFGNLKTLNPRELYKIKVQNSSDIDFIGRPVDVNTISIPVETGWNWIGYLPRESMSVPIALGSLTWANLDYIKGQEGSATYFSSYNLWFGSLIDLIPTQGYMLKVDNAGDLKYPVSGGKGSQISSGMEQSQFNPNQFEFSGSLTAKVTIDGVPKGSVKDSLYAYVNNELRGVTAGMFFPGNLTWVFDLMVHSNAVQGEIVSFKYYNSDTRKLYNCVETVTFTSDMVLYNALEPLVLHANPTATSVNEEDILSEPLLSIYPNPSENYVNIGYNLNESADVRITVYDTFGRTIRTLIDQKQEPDNYLFRWDSDLPPGGIYFIKLETGQKQTIRKVTILK